MRLRDVAHPPGRDGRQRYGVVAFSMTLAMMLLGGAPEPRHARAERAEAVRPEDVLRAVGLARERVTSLVGDLTQERTIGLMKAKVRSTGRFAVVRPHRLRWELFAPDSATYVIGPEGLSVTTPEGRTTAKAVPAKVGASLEDVRALVGGDVTRLADRYALTVRKDGARWVIEGRAKAASAVVKFRLVLEADLVTPVELDLEEGVKDVSTIRFANVVKDKPPPPALMLP